MSGPLTLPPIEVAVESPEDVRARAVSRLRRVGVVLVAALLLVGARGVQLCLSPTEATMRAAAVQRWDTVTFRARRGDVLDRNGRRLATSVATPNVVVDPVRVRPEERDALAARVAALTGGDPAELAEKMGRESRYQRLAIRVHPATAAAIEAIGHAALWVERETQRYYPEEVLAAQVLGFVDASGTGREGVESSLDRYLRGGSVLHQRRRDRRGMNVDDPTNNADRNVGMDVRLTLDRTVQRISERALARLMERSEPLAASAVVVEVQTGDILAMASTPSFNPNRLQADPGPRRNRTVQDAVEPGSVFKPFTLAAAMQAGIIDESSLIDCEGGVWSVGRTRIHDDHPHGVVTASDVLKYSSNIGTAKLALELGPERFLGTLADFGFGARAGIGLPGERAGTVRAAGRIRPIELATTSYGQGVTTTPLHLAMAVAALGNDGVRMKPRLIDRIVDSHGVPERVWAPEVAQRAVSAATARAVVRMMMTVSDPGGTAQTVVVPGFRIAGKTGTAEKVVDGQYTDARIASFVGLVPAEDPRLAIVVIADEPSVGSRYGAHVAGPAFAEIAGPSLRYLGVPATPDPAGEPEPVTDAPQVAALIWNGSGWRLPDLTGQGLRDVVRATRPAGLALALQGSGRVVAQDPAAGVSVAPGAGLTLVLR